MIRPRLARKPKPQVQKVSRFSTRLAKALEKKKIQLVKGWHDEVKWTISTGLRMVDVLTARDLNGYYGIPGGALVLIVGQPKSMKTTLTLNIIAAAQQADPLGRRPPMEVLWLETEGGLIREDYIKLQGVEVSKPYVHFPETLEEGFDIFKTALEESERDPPDKRVPILCVLDSISNAQTGSDQQAKSMSNPGQVADHAKIVRRAARRLSPLMRRTRSILLVVAQTTANISIGPFARGNPDSHIAEKALGFGAAIKYVVKRKEWIKKAKDGKIKKVGLMGKVVVDMNKVGDPGGEADDIVFTFRDGFDRLGSLHDALVAKKIVEFTGKNRYIFTKPVNRVVMRNGKKVKEPVNIDYVGRDGIKSLSPKKIAFLEGQLVKS